MKLVTIDIETYWSQTHSLTKMNPITYITHPETELQSAAIKIGDEDTFVLFGQELYDWLDAYDFSDVMLVGHNMSGFDGPFLAFRYGVNPKMWGCTLAMARQCGFAKTVGVSLKKVAADLGLGAKLDLEATNTKGKKLADFTAGEIEAMRTYNTVDTDLCYGIFKRLVPTVGGRGLKLIDMTVRMLTEPKLEVDTPLLEATLKEVKIRARKAILDVAEAVDPMSILLPEDERLEASKKILASATKFAKYLASKNVPVPMKPSPSNPDKLIPALAKTDQEFLALQEHPDESVAMAATARLGVKSTILETRLATFLEFARCADGKMPIYLNYYGADTTGRFSGGWKINHQNMPRVNPYEPKLSDSLRNSLRAPKGFKVVVADLSGIELRVNHFLWNVESSVSLYRESPDKADLYKAFASMLYGKPESDVTKQERQLGKISQLGLGFGAAAATFKNVAKIMGGVDLTQDEADNTVAQWRAAYPEITYGWKLCHKALSHIYHGRYGIAIDPWGLCRTAEGGIKTPKGFIHYPALRAEEDENDRVQWVYGVGNKKARIYAGKVDENCVQHLAREVICDMALTVQKRYPIVHTVHDELITIVPDDEAQTALDFMLDTMKAGVDWWPELITSGEGDIADTYGAAK